MANWLEGENAVAQPSKPPGDALGTSVQTNIAGLPTWAAFIDEQEYVPELAFPSSVQTYHKMRSDSQVEALHTGTTAPLREMRWSINPNKAPAKLVEQLSADLGLPIRGKEDEAIPRRPPNSFSFDAFLSDALLALVYGFMHFEIAGRPTTDWWHLLDLEPRHPRLTQEFLPDEAGKLAAIRQSVARQTSTGWARLPPPIPAAYLMPLVWRSEAGSFTGRSLLRSVYREWLVKDRVIRVAAINIQRGAGVPVAEGAPGMSEKQLEQLAELARNFKVAEGGGGAVPFGTKLTFPGAQTPDALGLLKYCDECMARVWALMLVQLGQTQTGSRALGEQFSAFAARAQRAIAKWICDAANDLFERYTQWNAGTSKYAPLLNAEQTQPDALSVEELAKLVEAELLSVDPELEEWLRNERGLPKKPEPLIHPELGEVTPEEQQLIQNKRNPPPLPAPSNGQPTPPANGNAPAVPAPVAAVATLPRGLDGITLPDRPLKRQPTENEIKAAVDFRGLDAAHSTVAKGLESLYERKIIPAQIAAVGDRIRRAGAGIAGTPSKAQMVALTAPEAHMEEIADHLTSAARSGFNAASREVRAQGGPTLPTPEPEHLQRLVVDQAEALSKQAANGISLAAQRKAASLVSENGRDAEQIASEVESYLGGLKNTWTMEQLRGAITMAQNAGRIETFRQVEGQAAEQPTYEASELLDEKTCGPCEDIDGTEFATLEEAMEAYASGGYVNCEGGPNCRGTLVAVYGEQAFGQTPSEQEQPEPVGG